MARASDERAQGRPPSHRPASRGWVRPWHSVASASQLPLSETEARSRLQEHLATGRQTGHQPPNRGWVRPQPVVASAGRPPSGPKPDLAFRSTSDRSIRPPGAPPTKVGADPSRTQPNPVRLRSMTAAGSGGAQGGQDEWREEVGVRGRCGGCLFEQPHHRPPPPHARGGGDGGRRGGPNGPSAAAAAAALGPSSHPKDDAGVDESDTHIYLRATCTSQF